jgi:predicted nucleotidyltransferase component of viral defense system
LIPASYIQEWSIKAPWPTSYQIEQDLIISRALCDLFNAPALAGKIAFRGGTAIHKLLFKQPLRYSEDIDLIQTQAEQIGATASAIREALSWLGDCKREQAGHSMHFVFRFAPEAQPDTTLKVKVEINTREHDSVLGIRQYPFAVENGWYQASANIASFAPEELFGTKLRALLQRRKNRDLFDLYMGLQQLPTTPKTTFSIPTFSTNTRASPVCGTRISAHKVSLKPSCAATNPPLNGRALTARPCFHAGQPHKENQQ